MRPPRKSIPLPEGEGGARRVSGGSVRVSTRASPRQLFPLTLSLSLKGEGTGCSRHAKQTLSLREREGPAALAAGG